MTGFLDLPTDVHLAILEFAFVVDDILSLRRTCRTLYGISNTRTVWQIALQQHVLDQDMPIPRLPGPIESLSDKELEHSVLRAIKLRRNWSSPMPSHRPLTRIYPDTIRGQPMARNIATHFISGAGGRRWLLTLSLSGRHWALDCWDIGVLPPRSIGQRQYERTICGFAFNTSEESENAVAICQTNGSIDILSLNLRATQSTAVFSLSSQLSKASLIGGSRLPVLAGKFLLIQYPTGHLGLVDISRPGHEAQLTSLSGEDEATCLAAIFNLHTAVVFRRKSVEIYDISNLEPLEPSGQRRKLAPLDSHIWQWGADKLSAIALPQWPATHTSALPSYLPITILLRHSSIYPWPVNILHQYTLSLTTHYDPTFPLSSTNLPYNITPIPIRSISSPVSLTALSSSTLGSYGTAVWFDSNTEEYFGPGTGQRVAGIFTSLPPVESDDDNDKIDEDTDEESDDESDGEEQVTAASVSQMEASSVFASRRQDGWINIAIDEVEGRIALGCDDGGVDLLEYE